MKSYLTFGYAFLIMYITTIKIVDSQLDFGDPKDSNVKESGGGGKGPVGPGKQNDKSSHGIGHNLGGGRFSGHVQIIPQSLCIMKADPGYCNLIIGRWYYDHRYHRCLPFLYTGCGGNLNNFISMKKCEESSHQCHFISTPLDPLTKHALQNPLNPLGALARDFVLAG